jgi:hypothetical protein
MDASDAEHPMTIGAFDAHKISTKVYTGTIESNAEHPVPIGASDAQRKGV